MFSISIRKISKKYSIVLGVTFLLVGFLLFIAKDFLYQYNSNVYIEPFLLLSTSYALILFGTGLLLFNYLQGSFSNRTEQDYYQSDSIKTIQKLLFKIDKSITKMNSLKGMNIEITEKDKNEIFRTLSNTINEKIDLDLLKIIEEKYSPAIIKSNQYSKLVENFERVVARLEYEKRRSSNKANLNLVIGTLITIIAATSLGYIVFQVNIDFANYLQLISHYIPKLSLIVFIEIFAYFFLKLYKTNLNDIKYYQNELLNVESKFISLKSAFMIDNEEIIKIVLSALSKTERNFFLKSEISAGDIHDAPVTNKDIQKIIKMGLDAITNSK